MGTGALIPAEVVAELARQARVRPLLDFTTAGAEAAYRPSRGLAEFVRARDLTCRAPGCDRPATHCDIDHTIPWPAGPTHAGNLACLCRDHHLLKTFWGWRSEQLADGTLIWTLPGSQRCVTTPGSALLFPTLMTPTPPPQRSIHTTPEPVGDRSARMPRRTRTREQNRAARIAAERRHNRNDRRSHHNQLVGSPPVTNDADPPPF
jgi:hypothetical protein